jgi:hypothetical protein
VRFLKPEPSTLQTSEKGFDVVVATHKKIDLVFHTQVFKLKREMQKKSRALVLAPLLPQNEVLEGSDETPTYSPTAIHSRSAPAGAAAAGCKNHSGTSGENRCK